MLSALGVIAEQPQLIEDILLTKQVILTYTVLHNAVTESHEGINHESWVSHHSAIVSHDHCLYSSSLRTLPRVIVATLQCSSAGP